MRVTTNELTFKLDSCASCTTCTVAGNSCTSSSCARPCVCQWHWLRVHFYSDAESSLRVARAPSGWPAASDSSGPDDEPDEALTP